MRVRFYIEKRRGDDGKLLTRRRPIFMTVAFHGKRVMMSTGQFVDLQWWNVEKQQVKQSYPDAYIINDWLKTLREKAGDTWKSLASLSEKPGAKEFREEFGKLRPRFSGGFFEVLIKFMDEGSERWSSSTYKKVRTFYNRLMEFNEQQESPLSFSTMNAEFLDRYQAFLAENGLSPVSIRKSVNSLVWFLNWSSDHGYNVYTDYRSFYKLLEPSENTGKRTILYLEWQELLKLNSYRTTSVREERVRDLFCLMCFTGLRFDELQHLNREQITETGIAVQKKIKEEELCR